MLFVGGAYLVKAEEKKEKDRKGKLRKEFKDAILAVSADLRAGYAVENAFRETLAEMGMLHGRDSPICRELGRIVRGMENNLSVEYLMGQFAVRSDIEEIREFADVFAIAKRTGGNLTEIIAETAGTISERIEVEKEIQTMLSAKRLELNIMSAVPFAIIAYVEAASGGYFDILYDSITGRVVMTICFVIYMAAYFLGIKIAEIPV